MTDREKLFNLLDSAIAESKKSCKEQGDCKSCRYIEFGVRCQEMAQVDYLIANGVEIFSAEDEKVLDMIEQNARKAYGDMRYLEGVKFGVESATKHGRWITEYWKSGYIKRCNCSLCGASPKDSYKPDNYCPNCGAKMDGAKDG